MDVVWKLECVDAVGKFHASYNKVFTSEEQAEQVKILLNEALPLMELTDSSFAYSEWNVKRVEVAEEGELTSLYHTVITLVFGERFRSGISYSIVPASTGVPSDTVERDKLTWTLNVYASSMDSIMEKVHAVEAHWASDKLEFEHDFSFLNL